MNSLERAGYLAHAKSASFRRKVEEARELLLSYPEHTICVSWGKDSTVLYHLAGKERRAVHGRYRDEERFPDLDTVRDLFSPGESYREVRVPGAWEMFERAGNFFLVPQTQKEREAFRWYHKAWAEAMLEATGELVALGIRREESKNRSRLIAMRGQAYRSKAQHVILPLANWTSRDIWAYILSRELPYARIYEVGHGGRRRERSDFTFGAGFASEAIWRHGAWESWKRAYPERLSLWVAAFPDMARYMNV